MRGPGRYFRLFAAFSRFALATELAYHANFFVKLFVEALWLFILLVFYLTIFRDPGQTIAGWTRDEYLFFVGCHYALGGLVETFFLENCTDFAELVRSGDLDLYLLKPIDEQFLITCRKIDWSTVPNILQGAGVMVLALVNKGWSFNPVQLVSFLVLFVCGTALAYSFLVLLCSSSVWLIRNQSLMEMWWLFQSLTRYPRAIYQGPWVVPLAWFLSFVFPVLLMVSVPAESMMKVLDPFSAVWMVLGTVAMLAASR